MPIYEYRCSNGHTFELFQRMADPPVKKCEVCGVRRIEKVLFPVAVHFKGSGFYSTDYGRGSKTGGKEDSGGGSEAKSDTSEKSEKSEKKDSSGGDSSSSSSGDSKPSSSD